MKKYLAVLLAVITAATLAFASFVTVGAADGGFSVGISAPESAEAGAEIVLSLSVGGITAEGGMSRFDMVLVYDRSAVEYVSADNTALPSSDWSFSASDGGTGLQMSMSDASGASPAISDGAVKCRAVFRIKSDYSGGDIKFAFSGLSARGAADSAEYTGASSGCIVKLSSGKRQLKTPENLIWTDMSASWSAVENAVRYKVQLYFNGSSTGAVYETDSSYYDFSDIIKESGEYTFKVIAVGGEGYADSAEASSASFSFVKNPSKLSAPTSLSFNRGIASWGAVSGAGSYRVTLYKNGGETGSSFEVTGLTYDFSDVINESGAYTFRVKAYPASGNSGYTESDYSSVSPEYAFSSGTSGRLETASVSITENKQTGGITYTITDNNDPSVVKNYTLFFYKDSDGSLAYSIPVYSKSGDIACDGVKLVSGTSYRAAVQVISSDKSRYENSGIGEKSGSAYAQDAITGIAVRKQPKIKYKAGDKLDLSKMEVRLTYGSGKTVDVGFKDFDKYGITISYDDGAILSADDNGKRVTVKCNDKTAGTSRLEIEANENCTHEKTTEERKEPTCTESGYLKVICTGCGKEMSKETIPPKGHTYGDWTVEREATLQDEGLRKHICTVCGFEEAEVIPMLVPETTAPADSDPDAADGSSDGKTMNTVLVGIMCFLIVAIAADIVAIVMVRKRRAGVKIGGAKRTDENEEDGGQPGDGYDENADSYDGEGYDGEQENADESDYEPENGDISGDYSDGYPDEYSDSYSGGDGYEPDESGTSPENDDNADNHYSDDESLYEDEYIDYSEDDDN